MHTEALVGLCSMASNAERISRRGRRSARVTASRVREEGGDTDKKAVDTYLLLQIKPRVRFMFNVYTEVRVCTLHMTELLGVICGNIGRLWLPASLSQNP
jgi:hypothetical protein